METLIISIAFQVVWLQFYVKIFACSTMHANSDGISDFHIRASNKLILELQNNGNIYYYESPNDSIFSITGEGEIIKYLLILYQIK